ncbi:hypothetical protein MRX96_045496 [Rhipicephalus microplus]|uniref:uncharacterized protein LOC119172269 n=1 Tax=Rhipicephalus microplus TaxID=6941 RepID=UPI003F6B1372
MHLRLNPFEEVAVLEQRLNAAGCPENVHELELTNGVVADPDDLCRCIIRCTELRKLYCVSSGIRLKSLIINVLPKLPHLSHLELTLDECVNIEEALSMLSAIPATETISGSLRQLYVEVSGMLRIRVLGAMLEKLPNLAELHVHNLRELLSLAVREIESLWIQAPTLQRLRMTSETPTEAQEEPVADRLLEDPDLRNWAMVCGNLLLRRDPPTRNCVRVRDLAIRTEPLHPTEPVIIVINNDEGIPTASQIREAGTQNDWRDVRGLTLALVRSGDAAEEVARANAEIESGLLSFLRHFTGSSGGIGHLKELNLSSFHFADMVDFTRVLSDARLTTLTALSVTPCAIWYPGALRRLATTCHELDDLDIRVYSDYRRCSRCWQPLALSAASGSHLTRGRLTFYNMTGFASLDFLSTSRISELRMSDKCDDAMVRLTTLFQKLRQNTLLRCLVVSFPHIRYNHEMYQDLPMLQDLCFLSLETSTAHDEVTVRDFIEWVASHSNALEVIHVHFPHHLTGMTERFTWVRSVETSKQSDSGDDANPPDPATGRVFTDRPCVICSTQTFIGLIKPHNRGARTQM